MAQYAVPISDVASTGATTNGSCGPSYTSCINDGIESNPQDSGTYVQLVTTGGFPPDDGALKVNLTSLSTPEAGTKTLRMVARTPSAFIGDTCNVLLEDGTSSQTLSFTTSDTNWTLLSNTVTTDFDWSNLTANMQYAGFSNFQVGDLELEIPDEEGGGGGGAGPKLNPEAFLMFL